jgi:general secretion pathway protein H
VKRQRAGASLIELLVVLAVVGAVLGAVTLGLGGRADRLLETSAQRAQALVRLACERALLTGLDLGWRLESGGWRFGFLRAEGWQPIGEDRGDELRPRSWDEGVRFALRRDGVAVDPEAEPNQPQLVCLASGELSAFELELSHDGSAQTWRLRGTADGQLSLERGDGLP